MSVMEYFVKNFLALFISVICSEVYFSDNSIISAQHPTGHSPHSAYIVRNSAS